MLWGALRAVGTFGLMADTTRRTSGLADRRRLGIPDSRPRPVGQSFWVLASVVAAGLAVVSAGDQIGQVGATATAGIEEATTVDGAQLIELADRQRASGSTTSPPAPGGPTTALLGPSDVPDQLESANQAGMPDHVAVGREALAAISYPWSRLLPNWTIEFLPATDGLYGLTLVPERRIEIYVRADQSPRMVSHVIAHELGHAVDVTFNDGPDRRRWSELRDLGSAPWWPDSGATDFATGAGDFAESFAAWQVGPAGFRSTLAEPPTGTQIELLAELSAG